MATVWYVMGLTFPQHREEQAAMQEAERVLAGQDIPMDAVSRANAVDKAVA